MVEASFSLFSRLMIWLAYSFGVSPTRISSPGFALRAWLARGEVIQATFIAIASSSLFCNPVPSCIGAMKIFACAYASRMSGTQPLTSTCAERSTCTLIVGLAPAISTFSAGFFSRTSGKILFTRNSQLCTFGG